MVSTLSAGWVAFRDRIKDFGLIPLDFNDGVLTVQFDPKSSSIGEADLGAVLVGALEGIDLQGTFPGIKEFSVETIGS